MGEYLFFYFRTRLKTENAVLVSSSVHGRADCVVEPSHGGSPFGCWTIITQTTGQQLFLPASSHHLEQRCAGVCVLPGLNCIQQGKLNPRLKRRLLVRWKTWPGSSPQGLEFPRMELPSSHDGCNVADGTAAAWSAPSDPGWVLIHGTRMCSYVVNNTQKLWEAHVHIRTTIWQPLQLFITQKNVYSMMRCVFLFCTLPWTS